MHLSAGSLIAFACAPGAIANDLDEGQRNGLFTKYLLQHIGTANEDIRMDQNFLIPCDDADIAVKGVKNRAILAQKLLDELTDRNPFVTIFLLDCCRLYYLRDRNLEQLRARGENLDTPKSSGLKEMHLSAGSLIAFACAPGAIANDLEGQRNGLFTKVG
ncbi:unnamed protein product [Rotaria sordida]|uniref:Peptidase C14 caspase domain-containing protein n=1 Tax=Rotaria sordida TaxID=392033 RepID=A0A815TCP2_9BILA|nr:unnamed protein product [Rotaria sordida]